MWDLIVSVPDHWLSFCSGLKHVVHSIFSKYVFTAHKENMPRKLKILICGICSTEFVPHVPSTSNRTCYIPYVFFHKVYPIRR